MDYKTKYLKYKIKYNNLKKIKNQQKYQQIGGYITNFYQQASPGHINKSPPPLFNTIHDAHQRTTPEFKP